MPKAKDINIEEDSVQILVDNLKGNHVTNQLLSSISMVPSMLRDVSPASYNPRVVSIGPLHHKDQNLRAGERLKKAYVWKLLVILPSSIKQTLEECLSQVNESIDKIRECYVGMIPYSDAELARIMVMDGCFIISYLCSPFTISDRIHENAIVKDLLLIENQIPFFVLNNIFECAILKYMPTVSLINDLILPLCTPMLFKRELPNPDVLTHATNYDHILGLVHKYYKPPSPTPSEITRPSISSVVELENAGVSFKPNEEAGWIMDIKIEWLRLAQFFWLWDKPTLKMPKLMIYDSTEMILRNMIAYEQTAKVDRYFTSYASAIDDLVDSHHDIAKLVESKVIINRLGSNEEAANMINNICKNVIVDSFYFQQWQQLETYCNNYWPKQIARLRSTYYNNPWKIIALLVGVILFVLTTVQTCFTINPKK